MVKTSNRPATYLLITEEELPGPGRAYLVRAATRTFAYDSSNHSVCFPRNVPPSLVSSCLMGRGLARRVRWTRDRSDTA